MEEFNSTFLAFFKEAQFTKDLLAVGVTQLYKANYAVQGLYYQSFSCLSVGLERMEKLCLILDYYIENGGELPPEKEVRGNGHRLASLFDKCRQIAKKQNISFHFVFEYDDIHRAVLQVLDDFADSPGRYANLNLLTKSADGEEKEKKREKDCARKWCETVDTALYEKRVCERRKARIHRNARIIGREMAAFTEALFFTEDGKTLTDLTEASARTGIWQAVAPYRQLYVLQIARYLTELIEALGYLGISLGRMEIPLFSEIFGLFYNEDSYFLGRKTWDTL